jgi:hypothetical protein
LDVPKGFDQNGPLLRREVWKYRHIPAPSLLALSHFASNLDGAAIEYGTLSQLAVIVTQKSRARKRRDPLACDPAEVAHPP